MAFNSDRDLLKSIAVPLEYAYIFERDDDGRIVTVQAQPQLHKFKLIMSTRRAAEIDEEESARVKKLAAGNGYEPLSEVELLVRLTLTHYGFDDFPAFERDAQGFPVDRKDFETKMREYFGKGDKRHMVNDALVRHQSILLPQPFRVGF
jgi:hypothetical protein